MLSSAALACMLSSAALACMLSSADIQAMQGNARTVQGIKTGMASPLFNSLHLLLLMHELLLDLGHVIITLDHFCVVVGWSLPWRASSLKLAYCLLCSSQCLDNICRL